MAHHIQAQARKNCKCEKMFLVTYNTRRYCPEHTPLSCCVLEVQSVIQRLKILLKVRTLGRVTNVKKSGNCGVWRKREACEHFSKKVNALKFGSYKLKKTMSVDEN